MRWMTAGLIAIMAVGSASAQDACTEESPCPVELDIDEFGFTGATQWNATHGDWLVLSVTNWDDLPHDVAIASLGIEQTVYPWSEEQGPAMPFQVAAGDHAIVDDMGNQVLLLVAPAPEAAQAEATGNGSLPDLDVPSPALALAAMAVVLAARIRRQ